MGETGGLTRRLPTLLEHLGAEPSGEGFERWAETLLATQRIGLLPEEAKFARIMNTFMVACVEQMNREASLDQTREGVADSMAMWSRAAGYVTMMALASVAQDDAPLRRLARIYAEDFKVGAKMAADAMAEPRHG